MICKSCGGYHRDDVSFCTFCGEALRREGEAGGTAGRRSFFRDKKILALLGGGLILALGLVILVLCL